MEYFCKSKLSLSGLKFFEEGKLYKGRFDEDMGFFWMCTEFTGEIPIEKEIFNTHFEYLNIIRDIKLKEILK